MKHHQPPKTELEVRITLVWVDDLLASFSECWFSESCLQSTGAINACERRRTTANNNKAFIALEEAILLAPLHSWFSRECANGYESDAEWDSECVLYRGSKGQIMLSRGLKAMKSEWLSLAAGWLCVPKLFGDWHLTVIGVSSTNTDEDMMISCIDTIYVPLILCQRS